MLLGLLVLNSEFAFADNNAKRLLDDLLKDYDNVVRPVTQPSECIKLYLGIKLSQIADIVSDYM